ncbi:MAG: response regulator [Anaerolineae bacterium]|nr:response regulator [Anaerolineae bacterium]
MSKSGSAQSSGEGEVITILLVDDIPDTLENIKKLISFEQDMKVVGTARTGSEGVVLAKELRPNIIIMDINMPDMDGIQATTLITEAVPTIAVIMMSVQNDPDYLRRAMLAGARNFLTKPIEMDELYNTIRTVHARNKPIAAQYAAAAVSASELRPSAARRDSGGRSGHIITIYSPQGGVGTTTLATSVASGLMKEGSKVLLIDADLQFGDVGIMLNLQSQSTMVELIPDVDDLDTELFENIVATHDSGLKVLLGPSRPEFSEEVEKNPEALSQIIKKIAGSYDFVVIDTSTRLDELLLSLCDISSKVIMVCVPTIPSVKNARLVLDLFDKLKYPLDKVMLTVNRVPDDRQAKRAGVSLEKISDFLKRPVVAAIPANELMVNRAITKAVPVVASERDKTKSPIKELLDLADAIYEELEGAKEAEVEPEEDIRKQTRTSGLRLRLGR